MTNVEKIAFLENVPLFSGMATQELMYVAGIVQEDSFSAGETVIREEDAGDSMFVVVAGEVMVHRRNAQLAKLRSKDFFGEMSLLNNEPRSASVTTVSNCRLLRIEEDDFWQLLIANNSLAVAMVRVLAERLRELLAENNTVTPGM
jgi:CRP/FNR family transcriptional regulator, cyclic AMP receptor protein